MTKLTPMMKQYMEIKGRHRDCILFFRLGDFYEMFFDDALLASKELEITLTARDCGLKEKAPMCGVPFHSADSYIARLIEKGHKVAICEQVEDPSKAVGIVKRDVVKIITSGTLTDSNMLDDKTNNYLCALYIGEDGTGITYADISTGELYATEIRLSDAGDLSKVIDELGKISPSEIVTNVDLSCERFEGIKARFEDVTSQLDQWYFEKDLSERNIKSQFKTESLGGIGLHGHFLGISSTGALLEYLNETQKTQVENIRSINVYSTESYMVLDISTRRNLELLETIRGSKKRGSLLSVLDKTSTSMGGRLIKRWIEEPLVGIDEINGRLDIVESLYNDIVLMDELERALKGVYDMERLIGKIAHGNCNGRVMISLKNSIAQLPGIKKLLCESPEKRLADLGMSIDTLRDVFELIDASIEEDCPVGIKEGHLIKETYSDELKELRDISLNGKQYLARIEESEKQSTGIKNLKISYNKVFGYFIEVTKSNLDKVPDSYIRKQTLANAERYITEELKDVENKILGSRDAMIELEYEMFNEIRDKIKLHVDKVQETCRIIASIDVLSSLSRVAYMNNYVRPTLNTSGKIDIREGRHPVVEKMIGDGSFISNDTLLDCEDNRVNIITGPNMSGKSTYMRQVALITLMAQIGSFVPASGADISVVDRIFTRIGASDDLSEGQSTFMVEMSEVANILNNATSDSLVILDEIGRGTSTYDGLSIAWAVVEHISKKNLIGAKTLFATHYHELTELESKIKGIKNYRIKVEEKEREGIVFLRKIERGGADRSYGIEVAKLAGVSRDVTDRAYQILESLEEEDLVKKPSQISLFGEVVPEREEPSKQEVVEDTAVMEMLEDIRSLDIISMTPLDAMNKLYSLVEKSKGIRR